MVLTPEGEVTESERTPLILVAAEGSSAGALVAAVEGTPNDQF
jgi:hypothetical protein